MTVGQLIEEGVATHHFFKKGSDEMRNYVLKMMEACGLRADMLHRYPHQFAAKEVHEGVEIGRVYAV